MTIFKTKYVVYLSVNKTNINKINNSQPKIYNFETNMNPTRRQIADTNFNASYYYTPAGFNSTMTVIIIVLLDHVSSLL